MQGRLPESIMTPCPQGVCPKDVDCTSKCIRSKGWILSTSVWVYHCCSHLSQQAGYKIQGLTGVQKGFRKAMMAYHQILNKTVESLTLTPSTQPLALSGSLKCHLFPPCNLWQV